MYTLFELDEHYPGTRLYEVTDTTDPDFPKSTWQSASAIACWMIS